MAHAGIAGSANYVHKSGLTDSDEMPYGVHQERLAYVQQVLKDVTLSPARRYRHLACQFELWDDADILAACERAAKRPRVESVPVELDASTLHSPSLPPEPAELQAKSLATASTCDPSLSRLRPASEGIRRAGLTDEQLKLIRERRQAALEKQAAKAAAAERDLKIFEAQQWHL